MGIGAEVCDTTCIENRITVDMNNYIIIRNAIPQNLFYLEDIQIHIKKNIKILQ